ncbi:MAG: sensor histidine kinase [Chloroflexi bacterium]|nr:sensor histidine kinase [Chloroflexota bacterium]
MRQLELRPLQLDAVLADAVEDLRVTVGAASVCLFCGAAEGACASPNRPEPGSAEVRTCTPCDGCGHSPEAGSEALVVSPHETGNVGVFFCMSCRMTTGETLTLHLGFPDASLGSARREGKLARLALPVFMWARGAVEGQTAETRMAQLENRFRAELLRAMEAQEQDREWLSYEIHDRVAQTLASVFQQLQSVESMARASPEIRHVAVRASVLLREAIREARSIMNNLHPPVLHEVGLGPLLEEELRRLEEDTGCRVKAALDGHVRLPRDVELVLYRIAHEALINIRRHAAARDVAFSLACGSEGVQLLVEDDGVGFDLPKALATTRVGGLMSMQRRAELAGGSCSVESHPGQGTRVVVRIPTR